MLILSREEAFVSWDEELSTIIIMLQLLYCSSVQSTVLETLQLSRRMTFGNAEMCRTTIAINRLSILAIKLMSSLLRRWRCWSIGKHSPRGEIDLVWVYIFFQYTANVRTWHALPVSDLKYSSSVQRCILKPIFWIRTAPTFFCWSIFWNKRESSKTVQT